MSAALEVKGLDKSFGALHVTREVSFALAPGARHALIGPNGAGKTTLINLITGIERPDAGVIELQGRDITSLPAATRVKRGLARTFQINQLFAGLPVIDNVVMALSEHSGDATRILAGSGALGPVVDEAFGLLEQLRLADVALHPVNALPYGRQRLVEIAIALALEPRVLLLDEPAAGVPSEESHIILDTVAALPEDIAVLIIEHDMDVVFQFAQSISVLVAGAILVEGTPQQIAADEQVRAVYLGEQSHV